MKHTDYAAILYQYDVNNLDSWTFLICNDNDDCNREIDNPEHLTDQVIKKLCYLARGSYKLNIDDKNTTLTLSEFDEL